MKRAKYICLEGTEGVGKTTQTKKLVETLKSRGFSVLQTKEPGTPLNDLTMTLRGIMLDNQYDKELTVPAREFISQAIRSIHLERVIVPALSEYDFIVQDRGILSGYAYGAACGNRMSDLENYALQNFTSANPHQVYWNTDNPALIYDHVVYLKGNVTSGLQKALTSKQEFQAGDAMESRGADFIKNASYFMDSMSSEFNSCRIEVDGKSIDEVHDEILNVLKLKEVHGQQKG